MLNDTTKASYLMWMLTGIIREILLLLQRVEQSKPPTRDGAVCFHRAGRSNGRQNAMEDTRPSS
jgi:hypothetical protein